MQENCCSLAKSLLHVPLRVHSKSGPPTGHVSVPLIVISFVSSLLIWKSNVNCLLLRLLDVSCTKTDVVFRSPKSSTNSTRMSFLYHYLFPIITQRQVENYVFHSRYFRAMLRIPWYNAIGNNEALERRALSNRETGKATHTGRNRWEPLASESKAVGVGR